MKNEALSKWFVIFEIKLQFSTNVYFSKSKMLTRTYYRNKLFKYEYITHFGFCENKFKLSFISTGWNFYHYPSNFLYYISLNLREGKDYFFLKHMQQSTSKIAVLQATLRSTLAFYALFYRLPPRLWHATTWQTKLWRSETHPLHIPLQCAYPRISERYWPRKLLKYKIERPFLRAPFPEKAVTLT